jgi:hypothetical protein
MTPSVFDPRNPVESILYALAWHLEKHHEWPAYVIIPGQSVPSLGPLMVGPAPRGQKPQVSVVRSQTGRTLEIRTSPDVPGVVCITTESTGSQPP